MAVTSSSNQLNNSLQLSGIRSAGLMSGLDTESLVKQMSAATKGKINKQQMLLDRLVWKQEGYRDVISKLGAFQSTYLNTIKPKTNIKSAQLMAAYKALSSNDKVTATASAGATPGTYKITDVEQLAKNAVIKSADNFNMTNSGVELNFSGAEAGKKYNVNIIVDGMSKDFSFEAKNGSFEDGLLDAVQKAFGNEPGQKGLNFKMENGALVYKSLDANGLPDNISHTFSIGASAKLDPPTTQEGVDAQVATYKALGLERVASNKINTGTKLADINFNLPLEGGSYTFEINGKEFTFDKNTTVSQMTATINGDKDAGVNMTFDTLTQKFSFASKETGVSSTIKITQKSGNLLSAMFGKDMLAGGTTMSSVILMKNDITTKDMSDVLSYEKYKNMSFDVTVNGVTKTIGLWGYDSNGVKNNFINSYDSEGNLTMSAQDKVATALNEQLNRNFGKGAPQFSAKNGKLSMAGGGKNDTISIKATENDENSLKLVEGLGFTSGQTNKLNKDMTLGDIGMDKGQITINGVTFNRKATFAEIDAIKGVFVDYETGTITTDGKVEANTPEDIEFAKKIFGKGFATYNGDPTKILTGDGYATNTLTSTGSAASFGTAQKEITITVNGKDTVITIPASADGYAGEVGKWNLSQVINKQLRKQDADGVDSGARFTYQNGKFELKGQTPFDLIKIDSATDAQFITDLGFVAGGTTPNTGDTTTTLKSIMGDKFSEGTITVNGSPLAITAATTIADLDAAGVKFKFTANGVSFTTKFAVSTGDAAGDTLAKSLFGDGYATYTPAVDVANNLEELGANAILTVNGVKMESNTNSITINGTTIGIGEIPDITKITEDNAITITTKRDTEPAMETIKKFVEDYNAMIENLNKTVETKRPRSGSSQTGSLYEPLTEEQKADMTEKEIEAWELKAKSGLLYADPYVTAALTKMRAAMNTMSVDRYTLTQMGITVSEDYTNNGTLKLDEEKLKTAFEKEPEKIQELFTDPEKGLGVTLEKAINSAISQKKSDGIGSLVALAGVENTSSTAENSMSKQIQAYQKTIDNLKEKYVAEQQRYWNKFTYLETMMAKYNEQASMFAQQTQQ